MKSERLSRRVPVVILAALVMLLMQIASATITFGASNKLVLKYGSYAPKVTCDIPLIWWCDEVAKRAAAKGVQIEFEYYWSGALAKPVDCLRALGSGVYHVGWITPAFYPTQVPHLAITSDTCLTLADLEVLCMATNELCLGRGKAEFEKANVKYISPYGVSDYNLLSTKPLRSLKEAKGFRCRTYGSQAIAWKELGGVPVSMAMPEVYSALQSGMVDGTLYMPTTIVAAKYYELAKHYTEMPFGPGATAFVMNMDTWKNLPESVKQIIDQLREEMPRRVYEMLESGEAEAREVMKKNGVTFYKLPAEDKGYAPILREKVWAEVAAKFDEKGLTGTEVLKFWDQLIEKYKAQK